MVNCVEQLCVSGEVIIVYTLHDITLTFPAQHVVIYAHTGELNGSHAG